MKTADLLAAGWTRLPESGGECGLPPGYCARPARWQLGFTGRAMCFGHAAQTERDTPAWSKAWRKS